MGKERQKSFSVTTPAKGASEKDLRALEKSLGMEIPLDFREFLKRNDGGVPSKTDIDFGPGPYQDARICYFFSVKATPLKRIEHACNEYKERLPEGYFPIARDEGSNLFLLGQDNHVYFWDHELEETSEPLTHVARSFKSFLEMLYITEPSELKIATLYFADGTKVRRVLPCNTYSKTRRAVVPVESLKRGEKIEEFGDIRTVVEINIKVEGE